MRSYLIDGNRQDHTVAIGIDDWWIADFASYIYREPATLFVEAFEESILIQISYEDEQELLAKIPQFARFYLNLVCATGYR